VIIEEGCEDFPQMLVFLDKKNGDGHALFPS
jgi:hypothetical protein